MMGSEVRTGSDRDRVRRLALFASNLRNRVRTGSASPRVRLR
jgi:hypothetical protein